MIYAGKISSCPRNLRRAALRSSPLIPKNTSEFAEVAPDFRGRPL